MIYIKKLVYLKVSIIDRILFNSVFQLIYYLANYILLQNKIILYHAILYS